MANLPYVSAPGSITKALSAIKSAATPARVSQDFVKTVLGIRGGSGDQLTSYLKKIGFAGTDGTPTDIYRAFRNSTTSGKAIAQAIRKAYAPLFNRNEFLYKLDDSQLRGLIVEETGQAAKSTVVALTLACIKQLKAFADFESSDEVPVLVPVVTDQQSDGTKPESESYGKELGLNLSYTINLNLPATSDVAVFNAIFKSLKDNLLKG